MVDSRVASLRGRDQPSKYSRLAQILLFLLSNRMTGKRSRLAGSLLAAHALTIMQAPSRATLSRRVGPLRKPQVRGFTAGEGPCDKAGDLGAFSDKEVVAAIDRTDENNRPAAEGQPGEGRRRGTAPGRTGVNPARLGAGADPRIALTSGFARALFRPPERAVPAAFSRRFQ